MSSRKWATVLRAAGRGPLGSRSSLDGDSMTTAEPWWARVQHPHVAHRTNRANTVRQLRTIVLPSYQTWCTARRAAQRFGAPLASPIARKQGVGSIQITDGLPIALAFAPACCLAAAPGAGLDRGDGQGSPARRPVDPSWARFPQNDPACALALGTSSITPFSALAHHLVVWPEPRVVPATTGAASPRTARYPLLWDIHSMVRPRVQRRADEKPSILGDAAAFGCANWWHAHSIGRRPAFVWTAPAPAQR